LRPNKEKNGDCPFLLEVVYQAGGFKKIFTGERQEE